MHKIIVTGGLGFIGSNLIKLLIDKKFEVINALIADCSVNCLILVSSSVLAP